jgi:plasmid stability protein
MANLQIKGIDDDLYVQLKALAASENRSISQQVVYLVKSYLSQKPQFQKTKTPAQVLLELSGSWEDVRPAEQIIRNLKKARKNSKKFTKGF